MAGIEIRLDWSLIIIFWLIAVNLGAGLFPARHPDWSPALSWTMAVIAAVLFLLSVLAHELAHALVGRAYGVPVERITLFVFGGVAQITREPPSPRAELLMAAVGPLTSIVIGVAATVLGALMAGRIPEMAADPMAALRWLGPGTTLLLWLGPVNILLGVFNLVPGFPLDGGRVLRAILWGVTHSFVRATRLAAGLGRLFGGLLIAAGVAMMLGAHVPWLGSGLVQGLWLAFIGWFLSNAAAMSYRQVLTQESLAGVRVDQVMRPAPGPVPADLSVRVLVDQHLMQTDHQAFPVARGDELIGLVSVADVRVLPRERWESTAVEEIMTPAGELETARPDESTAEVLDRLRGRGVEQLPVVDAGRLTGMVRRIDIVRWLELHPTPA